MKRTTLLIGILFTTGSLFAQATSGNNTAVTQQTGPHNQIHITQTSGQNNSGLIEQVGSGNDATLSQTGSENTGIFAVPFGVTKATSQPEELQKNIIQYGVNNSASTTINGNANATLISQDNQTGGGIIPTGYSSHAGSGGNQGTQVINGSGNTTVIMQVFGNGNTGIQRVDDFESDNNVNLGNELTLFQLFGNNNSATQIVNGKNNGLHTLQYGAGNQLTSHIDGDFNNNSSDIYVPVVGQFGSHNSAVLQQTGDYNVITIDQAGDNNQANIFQDGQN